MKCDVLQQIINHIERGIIYPVYEASIHLSIYKLLGEKKNDIDSFDNSIKYLYCYVQDSASQLIIVSLAKIFDQDKQSFSVYSLLKQCENYKRTSEDKKVIRTDKSKKLVKYFNLNEELIEIIKNPNKGNFFKKFNEEHLDRFLKGFEEELDLLKNLRDMHISHNDKKFNGIKYNVNKFDNLINYLDKISK